MALVILICMEMFRLLNTAVMLAAVEIISVFF